MCGFSAYADGFVSMPLYSRRACTRFHGITTRHGSAETQVNNAFWSDMEAVYLNLCFPGAQFDEEWLSSQQVAYSQIQHPESLRQNITCRQGCLMVSTEL